jgi:hypothetical protein
MWLLIDGYHKGVYVALGQIKNKGEFSMISQRIISKWTAMAIALLETAN